MEEIPAAMVSTSRNSAETPSYVFKVTYSERSEQKFQERAADYSLSYAFHGSAVGNFHSILHHGLISNMNKVNLFALVLFRFDLETP